MTAAARPELCALEDFRYDEAAVDSEEKSKSPKPSSEEADEETEKSEEPRLSPLKSEVLAWQERMTRVQQLWDAGNNAELQKVLPELEDSSVEEVQAFAQEMRRRLRPDPVAIGIWVLTLLVFCYLTYQFVLK